jgi:hypothetical protein
MATIVTRSDTDPHPTPSPRSNGLSPVPQGPVIGLDLGGSSGRMTVTGLQQPITLTVPTAPTSLTAKAVRVRCRTGAPYEKVVLCGSALPGVHQRKEVLARCDGTATVSEVGSFHGRLRVQSRGNPTGYGLPRQVGRERAGGLA